MQVEQRVVARVEGVCGLPHEGGELGVAGGQLRIVEPRWVGHVEGAESPPRATAGGSGTMRPARSARVTAALWAMVNSHDLKLAAFVRLRDVLHRLHEDVLRDVGRLLGVAEDAPAEVVDAVEVAVVELAEGVEVAGLGAADEQGVVHVAVPKRMRGQPSHRVQGPGTTIEANDTMTSGERPSPPP